MYVFDAFAAVQQHAAASPVAASLCGSGRPARYLKSCLSSCSRCWIAAFCLSRTSRSCRWAISSRVRAARSRLARPTAASATTRATVTATWVAASITAIWSSGSRNARSTETSRRSNTSSASASTSSSLSPHARRRATESCSARSRPEMVSPPTDSARSRASNTSAPGGSRSPCSAVSRTSSRRTRTAWMSSAADMSPLRGAAGAPRLVEVDDGGEPPLEIGALALGLGDGIAQLGGHGLDVAQAVAERTNGFEDEPGGRADQALVGGAERAQHAGAQRLGAAQLLDAPGDEDAHLVERVEQRHHAGLVHRADTVALARTG